MKLRVSPQGLCSVSLFTVGRQQCCKTQHIHRIALKKERRSLCCTEELMVQHEPTKLDAKTKRALEDSQSVRFPSAWYASMSILDMCHTAGFFKREMKSDGP